VSEDLLFTLSFVVIGALLIIMTMTGVFIARLPLSAAMLYLAVGVGIGPAGLGLVTLDPLRDAGLLERLTEIAVLISLFTAGLKLNMPFSDRRWRIPVQLATVSMVLTVAAVAALLAAGWRAPDRRRRRARTARRDAADNVAGLT